MLIIQLTNRRKKLDWARWCKGVAHIRHDVHSVQLLVLVSLQHMIVQGRIKRYKAQLSAWWEGVNSSGECRNNLGENAFAHCLIRDIDDKKKRRCHTWPGEVSRCGDILHRPSAQFWPVLNIYARPVRPKRRKVLVGRFVWSIAQRTQPFVPVLYKTAERVQVAVATHASNRSACPRIDYRDRRLLRIKRC